MTSSELEKRLAKGEVTGAAKVKRLCNRKEGIHSLEGYGEIDSEKVAVLKRQHGSQKTHSQTCLASKYGGFSATPDSAVSLYGSTAQILLFSPHLP